MELQLATSIEDNKKSFFRYVGSQRKSKGNTGPLLNQTGQLTTDAHEKANLLNGYFASVFHQPHGMALPTMCQGGLGEGDSLPSIKADLVKEHLQVSWPLWVTPKELGNIIAQPLAQIFESSWCSGEVPK